MVKDREQIRYDRMVENALRGVVREALTHVAERGLPGNHHFFLTFRTGHPGVQIPEYLRTQYPVEMTVVLQYQFFGLEVEPDRFAVTLSFNNVHERLLIPFAAITTFADPSVNFALQFQALVPAGAAPAAEPVETAAGTATPPGRSRPPPADEKRGEVVTLDAFRKK